ncbi:histidine phosphatase family protein [Actinoplanes utahensis]|uniref:histidine phosphatase family protein n=1 Tax=Actinoplanes utahensis TaxID=1869 RepID=UPI00068956C1|nr:histidine phosphatase family protein [Actinoplanes utahensis]GIF28817.1 phosphoglycerate mutase [Actinoplanes utahensis]
MASGDRRPGPAPGTRLILIRHGESHANTTRRLVGHDTCLGLTDTGRQQAAALRDRLLHAGGMPADALYTSELPRAIETAAIISPAVADGRCEPVRRCDLCEFHWGGLEGRSMADFGGVDSMYDAVATAGGESWVRFMLRSRRGLLAVAQRHAGQTAVIVTHGGVIRASMQHFAGVDGPGRLELDVDYTSMTVWSGGSTGGRWRLERFNDHGHLD